VIVSDAACQVASSTPGPERSEGPDVFPVAEDIRAFAKAQDPA
jgi:hypothetical protein